MVLAPSSKTFPDTEDLGITVATVATEWLQLPGRLLRPFSQFQSHTLETSSQASQAAFHLYPHLYARVVLPYEDPSSTCNFPFAASESVHAHGRHLPQSRSRDSQNKDVKIMQNKDVKIMKTLFNRPQSFVDL